MNAKKIISSITVGAGAVILGLGLQYALADWSAAPSSPPSNNVAAPINVSSSYQAKVGGLALGTTTNQSSLLDVEGVGFLKGLIVNGAFQYLDGNQGPGKVLTSDADGNAGWATITGGSGNTTGTCSETPTAVSNNTTYQNTTSNKLAVVATRNSGGDGDRINGFLGATASFSSIPTVTNFTAVVGGSVSFIVPPGYFYKVASNDYNGISSASAWQICEGGAPVAPQGTWCGYYGANKNNLNISCNGQSIINSCPNGYSRVNTGGNQINEYSCLKN